MVLGSSDMDLAERIRRGLKAALIARTIHVVSTGILMVVLARYLLAPYQYGLLFLAISTFGVAQLLADLGLAKSAARYLTEYRGTDRSQVPHIVTSSLKYRLVSTAAVAALFLLAREPLANLIGKEALAPLFGLGALYIGWFSLGSYTTLIFQGFNRVDWGSSIQASSSLSRVLFVVLFVTLVGGAVGALMGFVLSYALWAIVGLYVLYTRFYRNYERADSPEPGLSRRILRYSIPLTATRGANVLDTRIDTVLIGYFMNPVAVGYYYLGKQIVDFLQTPAASLGNAVSPAYGEQKATNRIDQASRLYQSTLEYTLLLYLPAGAGVLLVARPAIVYVFGRDYLGAVPVVQLFSIYVVLQSVTFITSNAIDYLGRANTRAVTKGATSIANFVLNVALIPTFGVVGAAAATVVTHGAYVVLVLYIVHQEFTLDLASLGRSFATVALITLGMAAIVRLLVPQIDGLVSLVGVMLVGGAIWAILAVLSGALDVQRVRAVLT